jgi:hypothetical protein
VDFWKFEIRFVVLVFVIGGSRDASQTWKIECVGRVLMSHGAHKQEEWCCRHNRRVNRETCSLHKIRQGRRTSYSRPRPSPARQSSQRRCCCLSVGALFPLLSHRPHLTLQQWDCGGQSMAFHCIYKMIGKMLASVLFFWAV